MASTFYGTKGAVGYPRAYPQTAGGVCEIYSEYALAGAALVINDLIKMVNVPLGAKIIGMTLGSDDLDTGGPTITLDVGDTDGTPDQDRYFAASVAAQAGATPTTALLKAGFGYTFAADGTIQILVLAAPTTGTTTGTIRLLVRFTV